MGLASPRGARSTPFGGPRGFLARVRLDTRPLNRRDFRNLWLGQAISTIGGEIGTVAVPVPGLQLTGSTAAVGLLGLASLVPLLVVPLVGGAIADGLDRRVVLLRTEIGMALVTGLFLAQLRCCRIRRCGRSSSCSRSAIAIYSLGRPALASLNPRLVPDDEIAAAAAVTERLRLARRRRRSRPSAAC